MIKCLISTKAGENKRTYGNRNEARQAWASHSKISRSRRGTPYLSTYTPNSGTVRMLVWREGETIGVVLGVMALGVGEGGRRCVK